MKNVFIILCINLLFYTCTKSSLNRETAENFYKTLSERKDTLKLASFLADDFQYDDIIFKESYPSKETYLSQINWNDPLYKFGIPAEGAFHIESILSETDSLVVITGMVNPYTYGINIVEARKFVSLLYFNQNGKIKKQEDWIHYPFKSIQEMELLRNALENTSY